jgi:hypothetical protein
MCTYMLSIDVYGTTIPLKWDIISLRYDAVFAFLSLLVREVEMSSRVAAAPPPNTHDHQTSSPPTPAALSVVNLLRSRYIEDLAVNDWEYRQSVFGECACNRSLPVHYKQGVSNYEEFIDHIQMLAGRLLRLSEGVAPSHMDESFAASIVITKTTDFVEDIFHWASHEVRPVP